METWVKPNSSGKPRVGILLECPRGLHQALKIAAAEAELTLQGLCFQALGEFLQRRRLALEARPEPRVL